MGVRSIMVGLQQQSTGLPPPYSLGVGQAAGGLQLGASSTAATGGLVLGIRSLINSYDH